MNRGIKRDFLDLLKEIVDISEVDGEELTNRLIGYMKKKSIGFESMRPFLPYYPERIYKNMYRKLDSHLYKYVGCQTCEDNEKRIYILSPTERCRTTNKVTSMSRSEMFM